MAYCPRRGPEATFCMSNSTTSAEQVTPIRVMVIDDHPIFRGGLVALIAAHPGLRLVAEGGDGEQAIALYREHRPDVTMMDLSMPLLGGADATERIVSEFPDARIVVLTTWDGDTDIHHALAAGARGYLLKNALSQTVVEAIRQVHRGNKVVPPEVSQRLAEHTPRVELTERELEVLNHLAKGWSNKEIAAAIGRTDATVKVHVLHILEKLGVDDRTGAVTVALKRGIIHL